jgi:O-antigen ligase
VVFLALCFFVVYTLATVVSIVPRLSFWGGYERLQGLYTTAAYGVVFLAIVTFLRTLEQVERLLSTALVVSVPVSLYGIIQHFGTDPAPWSGDVTQRVASTMGNPIFVAAFLSLIVPLTLYRHLEAGRRISSGESRGMQAILSMGSLLYLLFQVVAWCIGPTTGTLAALTSFGVWILEAVLLGKPVLPFIRIGSYSILLSTQLACILLSQSRGPWLGLLASLMFFVLSWLLTQKKWRGTLLLSGGGLAIVLLLVVVNLPDAPLAFVRTLPYVGRLGQIFESSGQVRLLIWQGSTRLVVARPGRMLIGYGPEAMHVAYPPYYPPALGHFEQRTALPDRAHNEIFDVLVTTGCLGLVVFLSFFTSLVLWGLQFLDLLRSPPQCWLFLALWGSGGVVAVLLAWWLEHSWRLFGVALPFGMLTGLFVYLGVQGVLGFRRGRPGRDEALTAPAPLLGSAVRAALIGHFVEIQFGIAIAATQTYFWALVALLVVSQKVYLHNTTTVPDAAPSLPPTASAHQGGQSRRRQRRPLRQATARPAVVPARGSYSGRLIASSLLVGLIMMTMVYGFLSFHIRPANLPSVV